MTKKQKKEQIESIATQLLRIVEQNIIDIKDETINTIETLEALSYDFNEEIQETKNTIKDMSKNGFTVARIEEEGFLRGLVTMNAKIKEAIVSLKRNQDE